MPKSTEQNTVLRQQMQLHILKRALKLFASKGYAATSIRTIAAECDISLGLMYNYFGSKEILLTMIIAQSLEDFQRILEVDEQLPPALKIEALATNFFGTVSANPEFWRLTYALRMEDAANNMLREIANQDEMLLQQFTRYFIESGSPAMEARLLLAAIHGICQQYLANPVNYSMNEMKDLLLQKFIPR